MLLHRYFILRHGETDANAADIMQGSADFSRLTDKGRLEAQAVGQVIASKLGPMHAVYVSPLSRATETLAVVRHQHLDHSLNNLPPETVWHDLRELDLHEWEGRNKADLQSNDAAAWQAWERGDAFNLVISEHKPILDVWERAASVWERLRKEFQQQNDGQQQLASSSSSFNTLLVCHGTMGQALLNTALGRDASSFRDFHFENCGLVEIEWPYESPTGSGWTWHHPEPSQRRRWTLSEWEKEKQSRKKDGNSTA
jgi:broad specificity phosphatase PhoE